MMIALLLVLVFGAMVDLTALLVNVKSALLRVAEDAMLGKSSHL